jgi:hypothetical protein
MSRREREPRWVELSASADAPRSPAQRAGATLELRPRTAPQLLDLGMEVLVARLVACVGICTLIWFPLRAATPWFVELMETNPLGYGGDEGFSTFIYSMLFMLTAQNLAAIVSTTSVTVLVHSELVGRPTHPLTALGRALRRLPALVGVFLINLVLLGSSAGLLGLLGLFCPPLFLAALALYAFFAWKFSVAPSALVLEELGVLAAMRRSWNLTRGSFLRWLGVAVLSFLLVSGLSAGMQLGDNPGLRDALIGALGIPQPVFDTVFVAVSSVFSGLSTACVSAALTAYYLDTRIRREGFDLAMRLERLRAAAGAAPGAGA